METRECVGPLDIVTQARAIDKVRARRGEAPKPEQLGPAKLVGMVSERAARARGVRFASTKERQSECLLVGAFFEYCLAL